MTARLKMKLLHPIALTCGLAAGMALALACATATAQQFPVRPIRIVPFGAGGPSDLLARAKEKGGQAWLIA